MGENVFELYLSRKDWFSGLPKDKDHLESLERRTLFRISQIRPGGLRLIMCFHKCPENVLLSFYLLFLAIFKMDLTLLY